jgi:geranylgeranyl diphosphate synthase type II
MVGDSGNKIVDALSYSLMAGGKRLRPILCIAATEAVGGSVKTVLPASCAIEMIHTYSLIHDDLPAIDNDHTRRGKPTCHITFDEATAIIAGDALLTLAFEVLASAVPINAQDASKWLNVIKRIATASGYKGMIEGQMRDIDGEGKLLTYEEIMQVHSLKTGALINASLVTGAILGNATPQEIDQLGIYGKHIGLAFQITDDILNIEGDPAIMGKAVGTDQARKKNTFPSIIGMVESKKMARHSINNALKALEGFDNKSVPLRAIAKYIIERKR